MLSQPPNRATMVAPIQLINPIIGVRLGNRSFSKFNFLPPNFVFANL